MSFLFHAVLVALCIPLVPHMPRITPEPFRWTINLVEPFNPPSEGPSTPSKGVDRPMAALTSKKQPVIPSPPSGTDPHENERGAQFMAAVQEQASPLAETAEPPIPSVTHADPMPQPAATRLLDRQSLQAPVPAPQQQTPLLAEPVRNREAPATRTEPARPQEIATAQPMEQTVEPALQSPSHSSDQPRRTAPVAAVTPSDAETPAPSPPLAAAMSVAAAPAVPVTRDDGESSPLVAAKLSAEFHELSSAAGASGSIQQDAASSAQPRLRSDYGWLQQALSRRLEELKRTVRPSIEESGRLRVLVKAVVSSTGELMETEIVNSSGHHRIDQDAMTLVQRAFPMSLDQVLDRPQIVMRIPITFSRD